MDKKIISQQVSFTPETPYPVMTDAELWEAIKEMFDNKPRREREIILYSSAKNIEKLEKMMQEALEEWVVSHNGKVIG